MLPNMTMPAPSTHASPMPASASTEADQGEKIAATADMAAAQGLGVHGVAQPLPLGSPAATALQLSTAAAVALSSAVSGLLRFEPLSRTPLSVKSARLSGLLVGGQLGLSTPPTLNKARILLTAKDFSCLADGEWLGDNIMNSVIALINHRDGLSRAWRRGELRMDPMVPVPPHVKNMPRVAMLNTYFYTQLVPARGCYDYEGVRTWTAKNGICLEANDLVLALINVNRNHWAMVVIHIWDRCFSFYDPYFSEENDRFIPLLRRWC